MLRSALPGLGLGLAVAAMIGSGAASAQSAARIFRVGYIVVATPEEQAHLTKAFEDALRDLGYVEGRNVVFERRFAHGDAETQARTAFGQQRGDQARGTVVAIQIAEYEPGRVAGCGVVVRQPGIQSTGAVHHVDPSFDLEIQEQSRGDGSVAIALHRDVDRGDGAHGSKSRSCAASPGADRSAMTVARGMPSDSIWTTGSRLAASCALVPSLVG